MLFFKNFEEYYHNQIDGENITRAIERRIFYYQVNFYLFIASIITLLIVLTQILLHLFLLDKQLNVNMGLSLFLSFFALLLLLHITENTWENLYKVQNKQSVTLLVKLYLLKNRLHLANSKFYRFFYIKPLVRSIWKDFTKLRLQLNDLYFPVDNNELTYLLKRVEEQFSFIILDKNVITYKAPIDNMLERLIDIYFFHYINQTNDTDIDIYKNRDLQEKYYEAIRLLGSSININKIQTSNNEDTESKNQTTIVEYKSSYSEWIIDIFLKHRRKIIGIAIVVIFLLLYSINNSIEYWLPIMIGVFFSLLSFIQKK